MLYKLFFMFVKLSMVSFGGGYVMIPFMIEELEKNGWAAATDVMDNVGIAQMCPGPVAVNAAVGIGYKVAKIPGVFVAFLGVALPCAFVVILVATYFFKISNHPTFQAILYGLRPVVTGIICFAAVQLALKSHIIASPKGEEIIKGYNIIIKDIHLFEIKSLIITLAAFFILVKSKIHPIVVIVLSGVIGTIMF